MFTGLVQGVGTLRSLTPTAAGVRLAIIPRWDVPPKTPLEPGESISIAGVCLTLVTDHTTSDLLFDAIPETLSRTTLGRLTPGSPVNLERSLMPTDLMGGHVVQGHIDAIGTVTHVQPTADWQLHVRPGQGESCPSLMPYIVPKGSICIEGVSLTIAGVAPTRDTFRVALIPTTLARTTLGALKPGDPVNLETDIMARTIVNYLTHFAPTTPTNTATNH